MVLMLYSGTDDIKTKTETKGTIFPNTQPSQVPGEPTCSQSLLDLGQDSAAAPRLRHIPLLMPFALQGTSHRSAHPHPVTTDHLSAEM